MREAKLPNKTVTVQQPNHTHTHTEVGESKEGYENALPAQDLIV